MGPSWPSPTTCKASSMVPVDPPINKTCSTSWKGSVNIHELGKQMEILQLKHMREAC